MRIAVISDVHGNLEALGAVFADMEQCDVQQVVCLGDSVGYGADPEAVVAEIRARKIPAILGNHELGLRDPSMLDWFNPPTQRSLLLTRRLLSQETMEYIWGLQPAIVAQGALLVHGAPPDSVTTYLFELSKTELRSVLRSMEQEICFVGHTHQLEIVGSDGKDLEISPLRQGAHSLRQGWRYIVNAGSVGQPRDGDNRAKYVIWDPEGLHLEVRFVPYDIGRAAAKILEKGFPAFNATRLW